MSYSLFVLNITRRYERPAYRIMEGTPEYRKLDLWICRLVLDEELTNEDVVNIMEYFRMTN